MGGQGTAASKQYNACIRRHTLKTAILDQLKNTKSVFRDVMQRHCLRKRAKLMAQCERSPPQHCLNPKHCNPALGQAHCPCTRSQAGSPQGSEQGCA